MTDKEFDAIDPRIIVIKAFNDKVGLKLFIYGIIKRSELMDKPYYTLAKQVYESNFSVDSWVKFWNVAYNQSIKTSDIEKLMSLQ